MTDAHKEATGSSKSRIEDKPEISLDASMSNDTVFIPDVTLNQDVQGINVSASQENTRARIAILFSQSFLLLIVTTAILYH